MWKLHSNGVERVCTCTCNDCCNDILIGSVIITLCLELECLTITFKSAVSLVGIDIFDAIKTFFQRILYMFILASSLLPRAL